MRFARSGMVAGAVFLCAAGQSAATGTLNTMGDVGAAIQKCWQPPADAKGASVTLSFSFKRDGSLMGKPKATAISVDGDKKLRQSFVDAAIAAVQNCAPLSFSPQLASGIAGQVFTAPFTSENSTKPAVKAN